MRHAPVQDFFQKSRRKPYAFLSGSSCNTLLRNSEHFERKKVQETTAFRVDDDNAMDPEEDAPATLKLLRSSRFVEFNLEAASFFERSSRVEPSLDVCLPEKERHLHSDLANQRMLVPSAWSMCRSGLKCVEFFSRICPSCMGSRPYHGRFSVDPDWSKLKS